MQKWFPVEGRLAVAALALLICPLLVLHLMDFDL